MKFKFVCSWCNDRDCRERVLRNWPVPIGSEVVDADYDYLIIFNNYPHIEETEYHKNVGFICEPSWSPNFNRNLVRYCRCVFTDKNELDYENVIDFNPVQLSHDSTSPTFSYGELLNNDDFNKKNKMSIIVSNWSSGDQNHNYFLREELVRKILKTDLDIHIYGKNWSINDKRYKGSPEKKEAGLRDYEFSIAVENCIEDKYATEKLFDCFLYNSIPLYYGANLVNNYYDSRAIIDLDLRSDSVIERLKEVYYSYNSLDYKQVVLRQKRDYFKGKHNIFNILKDEKKLLI